MARHIFCDPKTNNDILAYDSILLQWIENNSWEDNCFIIVMYKPKESCIVSEDIVTIKQVHLSDQRLLRCDSVKAQKKGEVNCHYIRVEFLDKE